MAGQSVSRVITKLLMINIDLAWKLVILAQFLSLAPRGGGGTLGLFGWGCAAETLEPLAYTRASSSEFCYPILE